MPASVFSRSTECHNQDKVSMGTIAARDALRVLELTEQVAAAHVIACGQAMRLRQRAGEVDASMISPGVTALMKSADTPMIDEDAPLDRLLGNLTGAIAAKTWKLEWPGEAEPAG